MASAAPANTLPLFYNQLQPLSSTAHADWKMRRIAFAKFLTTAHAIPITVDEFGMAQRHFPIVFSVGDQPVPLALMGLNEGVNTFIDDEGLLTEDNLYVPAYVRRYPFMLARLRPESEDLSLCFDPTAEALGAYEDGDRLFDNGEMTDTTRGILAFCEQFEHAGQRTQQFLRELQEADLLMDGEVSIQPEGAAQPFVYRGFRMISEDKLRDIRGDVARKMVKSGAMALVYAHLFSLTLLRDIFGRQVQQGKVPAQTPAALQI
jgi:hypothetical protein